MPESVESVPAYNLWTEPWIQVERKTGGIARLSLEDTLLHADDYVAIYESSPLCVVGIFRLLTAILQGAINPQEMSDIRRIWQERRFSPEAIQHFGGQYAHRFDLFSETVPFMQSADLPRQPEKKSNIKTVSYLAVDIPSATNVTHFRHGGEDGQVFCPRCAAACLVTIPAFATSGGQGIKPSINGVPPIYVLPGGNSLWEILASSLLLPDYQPEIAWKDPDLAWWARKPLIPRSSEVIKVGYLHSLTFAARRVRLHPEKVDTLCSRCGEATAWGVRTMIFEMGECRPKDIAFWLDPFAAYNRSQKGPIPIRPAVGRALWREYGGLFLHTSGQVAQWKKNIEKIRPRVLDQLAMLEVEKDIPSHEKHHFRCIGMRTDMKAKIFEWVDTGFDVPGDLLMDENAGVEVDRALNFASDCGGILSSVFHSYFGGKSKKQERHHHLKTAMLDGYWMALAGPFREYVLHLAESPQVQSQDEDWLQQVVTEARLAFHQATEAVGDDAASLRQRVQGEQKCNFELFKRKGKET